MNNKMHALLKSNQGGILVEFAFILPIMLMLTFPVIDCSRYILIQQKLVKAASFMADAAAMSRPILATTTQPQIAQFGDFLTEPTLTGIVDTINIHMLPFDAEQPGGPDLYQAILTHVYADASGAPLLGWQYDQNSHNLYDGARTESIVGLVTGPGDIGTPANIANIPPALRNLQANENFVVAEVFADYTPITPNLSAIGINFLAAQRLNYRAYFRARYGNLRCIWQVYMPPNC
jgi:hypothetical protein